MLRMMRGGQRWLTGLFVIAIGGVFVFFLGLQGPLEGRSQGTLVRVGPIEFGPAEFGRSRANQEARLRSQIGEEADLGQFSDTLDQLAARELVDTGLLALEGEALGLNVAKQEIEDIVRNDPAFQDEAGRFNREAFSEYAKYEYGSERTFIEDRRRALLSYKMLRLLSSLPQVSETEAHAAVVHQLERAQLAFVTLGGEPVNPESIANDAIESAIADRTEELQSVYDARSNEFNTPEQVRARHILFSVPPDADDAKTLEIREQAAAALVRVQAGEDFATLAGSLSQDPGSASSGGDLGFFGRGQMVPPFEEAAFNLKPSETSDLVRSDFGFHIIRSEERREATEQSFDDVKHQLARELLATEAATVEARAVADALADAIRAGESLEDAARAQELTLERSAPIGRRSDGYIPGLGASPEALSLAFTLKPGESSPVVFEVGKKFALLQVIDRIAADPAEIAQQLDTTRQTLLVEKRNQRSGEWLNARREALIADGLLDMDFARISGR